MGKEVYINVSESNATSARITNMSEDSPSPLFDLFWENSKLSEANIGEFQKMMELYSGSEHEQPALQFPSTDLQLPRPRDRLSKHMQKRSSQRRFANKPITRKQLGSLLAAFAKNAQGGRAYPSAGATYSVEVFCLVNNYSGELHQKVCYYNSDNHSLSVIDDLPAWQEYASSINLDTDDTTPSVVFVFAIMSSRTTAKYGERGGRFALIEVGHAAQNLSLRLVQEEMIGTAMGGLLDNQVKALLGLQDTTTQIALGFACGFKPDDKRSKT